jgi:RNA polymerase-binding transcription factor DksA
MTAGQYNESKARRANARCNIVERKLERSLQNRTEKERKYIEEIKRINSAYVWVICEVCKDPIRYTFADWKAGKFQRTCKKCARKKDEKVLTELSNLIGMLVPIGYKLVQSDGSIEIRKQRG